jgi:hypothetical protein
MKKLYLAALLLLTTLLCRAGLTTSTYNVPGYGVCNIAIYIPDNTTGTLPAVVFIPGLGEENTDINGLYVHGPLNFIKYGNWKPSFIVVGIQPCFGWPGNNFTNPMLQYLVSNAAFHINPYKITLTGLSAGANATFAYILQPNAPVKLAAAIAFSYAVSGSCLSNPTDYWSNYLCAADEPWHYLPYWGLCGTGDSFYGRQKVHYDQMTAAGWPNKRWTDMVGYAHYGWNDFYNPAWKQNNQSLYDWALQWTSPAAPVTTLPIKLASFNLTKSGNSMVLTWKTALEDNVSYFELLRSDDGITWSRNAKVDPRGAGYNYQVVDPFPVPGRNYYRLRTVDLDGHLSLSQVLVAQSGTKNVSVAVHDFAGRLVAYGSDQVLMTLKPGTYLLRYSDGTYQWSEKYFKP